MPLFDAESYLTWRPKGRWKPPLRLPPECERPAYIKGVDFRSGTSEKGTDGRPAMSIGLSQTKSQKDVTGMEEPTARQTLFL